MRSLAPEIDVLLDELKAELRRLYGSRLVKVILYGSYARGEAGEGSDVDVAVVLQGEVSPTQEIDRMLNVIVDLDLRYGVLLSVYPVSNERLHTGRSPLLQQLRAEGVKV